MKHVSAHHDAVPDAFSDKVSLDDHQKAANYTLAKSSFGITELVVSTLLLLGWTLGGGLNFIDEIWQAMGLSSLITGVGTLVSVFIINCNYNVAGSTSGVSGALVNGIVRQPVVALCLVSMDSIHIIINVDIPFLDSATVQQIYTTGQQ